VGAAVNAGAVSFAVDGTQLVTIQAGHALFTFALEESR